MRSRYTSIIFAGYYLKASMNAIGHHWLLFSKNDDSEIDLDEIAISVCGNDSEIDVPYYHKKLE
ncbi:hypothetical protein RhiirB3_458385 [Rhizophagus irregularis]|nr:hypothetical protein RhiirB3_458385 [Rhizophagus irregularis]